MIAGRYHRQTLLPQIGTTGQEKISHARVTILGCGALGTVAAEILARAGVGTLVLVDRDLVEPSNLQRQTLFSEADARESRPKAAAAAERLGQVNSEITLEPRPVDVDNSNIESLVTGCSLVLDATDNLTTRYLLNDACVKQGMPWVYGAAIATEGRAMPILPDRGPCLRCIFPDPAPASELPTCDTAGVIASVTGLVANLQTALALRILVQGEAPLLLQACDAWEGRFQSIDLSGARSSDCPCCGRRDFEFLNRPPSDSAALCGQDAVQIRADREVKIDLESLAGRLGPLGRVSRLPFLVRCVPSDRPGLKLSIFSDGRMIVQGTREVAEARSMYARFIGG